MGAVRTALRLDAPPARIVPCPPRLVGVVLLAALVAVQPAWEAHGEPRVRADAQVDFVLDTSRSMLASAGPGAPTRLDRAKRAA